MCMTTCAEATCPGSPQTSVWPQRANINGLPGLSATPWQRISVSPRDCRASSVRSRTPMELPPDRKTTSAGRPFSPARAALRDAVSGPSRSGAMPNVETSATGRSMAERASVLTSRIWPGRGFCSGDTSSSPVERMETLGRLITGTSVMPRAAKSPISCARSFVPRSRRGVPS